VKTHFEEGRERESLKEERERKNKTN
jgi:hypothetical protein